MHDRRRLLIFSTLILAIVALSAVAITAWHFQIEGHSAAGVGQDDGQSESRALLLATGTTLVVIAAGGTLLVRASNPFMRRLEESECRTRAILNTAADGIITLDRNGRIETFNVASERMFGCPAATAVTLPISTFIAYGDSHLGAVFSIRDLAPSQELFGIHIDGSRFPLEISVSQMCFAERESFTVIVRDITERKAYDEKVRRHVIALDEAHDRLEAKATELARINQELDDFTYIASHDLKEPLRGISSYCQILLEDYGDKLDQEASRRLQALVALCRRLGQLIDDLLTYSQIGRSAGNGADVHLDDVVQDVLQTLGPSIDERGAVISVVDDLPTVVGEPTMLGEVFRNLITNGVKFNESSAPRIEIGCTTANPPTIYVRDNGIGIPPQHYAAIFTMFRRLHGRAKYDGTGAGLTFVRKIVEAHGGRVWVESEVGCGSTFFFTLGRGGDCAREQLTACAIG